MCVVAIFGNVMVVDGLVTGRGGAARTAADITASAGRSRLGIAGLIVVIALDVVARTCPRYAPQPPAKRRIRPVTAGQRQATREGPLTGVSAGQGPFVHGV